MKIGIIGGTGKMGRWLARFLLGEGHEVIIAGRDQARLREAARELGAGAASNAEAARTADCLVLSVPIDSFEEVVRDLAPHVRPGQAVVEISSVKVMPVAAMHRHLNSARVLGAHPLFGPGARGIAHQNFVLTPTTPEEDALAGRVKDYLEERGARVTLMTPPEHDEMMSIILGLSHFIGIVSADTLLSCGKMAAMEPIGSVTYRVLLTLIESIISEDPRLYAAIQMNLPALPDIESLYQSKVKEWQELVRSGDAAEFARRMKSLKERFEREVPGFGKAYENMYRIGEGLRG